MNMTSGHSAETAERLLEIDQELREAIDRRDGVATRSAAKRQFRELQKAVEHAPQDGGGWILEASDRLRELVVRAQEAQRVIGAQITGVDIQRRLMGAPISAVSRTGGRSFLV